MKADQPFTDDGRTFHIGNQRGTISPYCLITGDSGRATSVVSAKRQPDSPPSFKFFENVNGVYRGTRFVAYTGTVDGVVISVASHGIGGPSVAAALRELGLPEITIRFGSGSALKKEPRPGDSAICISSLRYDGGVSDLFLPEGVAASADTGVTQALIDSATELGQTYHVGFGATTEDFYWGQGRPDPDGEPPPLEYQERHEKIIQFGTLCYDMENSVVFSWAKRKKVRAGAILALYGNRITNELEILGDEMAFQIALRAILKLHQSKSIV